MPSKWERAKDRQRFAKAQRAANSYAADLKRVAAQVDAAVKGLKDDHAAIAEMLRRYAQLIQPWARNVAERMLRDVGRRDLKAWMALGEDMGRALRQELLHAPTGQLMRELLDDQVHLITSLPLDAAKRVHDIAVGNMYKGLRADELMREILKTGAVTRSRAQLIAVTETARASSKLIEARSAHVGSDAYVWRTSKDNRVRESHRKMEGKVIRWDSPPTLSDGTTTHAGQIYRCRCWPEPILKETV